MRVLSIRNSLKTIIHNTLVIYYSYKNIYYLGERAEDFWVENNFFMIDFRLMITGVVQSLFAQTTVSINHVAYNNNNVCV